jgi:antitoxin CptB
MINTIYKKSMIINIKDLKNKIIYRANYRGTKEVDKLLGSFVKIYIDQLIDDDLPLLCDLLDYDDENLYKLNQGQELTIKINSNKVTELFKKYKYVSD